MTDAEVDATFAKAAAAGDEEPEIGDIEKADGSAAQMSDEDYEAFMKVSDLENRLASTKSNILKLKKGKSAAGDISDKPSAYKSGAIVRCRQGKIWKDLKEDESLRKWFGRRGTAGKEGGWVDCNTCREVDGKTKKLCFCQTMLKHT